MKIFNKKTFKKQQHVLNATTKPTMPMRPLLSHLQRKSSLPCSREPPPSLSDEHHTHYSTGVNSTNPPLKSCLKRKDSSASQVSTPNTPTPNTQPNLLSSKAMPGNNTSISSSSSSTSNNTTNTNNFNITHRHNASMIVVSNKNTQPQTNQSISDVKISEQMFVPYVGHLFICDHESIKRYAYYNNLEKNRRAKIYRQLIRNKNEKLIKLINQTLYDEDEEDEDDEEDEEEEEEEEELDVDDDNGALKTDARKHSNITSKSDNDLRCQKKTVKFIPHANTTINIRTDAAISPSTTNTTVTTASSTNASTPTGNFFIK
jgi:hypothetical protein